MSPTDSERLQALLHELEEFQLELNRKKRWPFCWRGAMRRKLKSIRTKYFDK